VQSANKWETDQRTSTGYFFKYVLFKPEWFQSHKSEVLKFLVNLSKLLLVG
jgi:hypothetical protein